MNNIPDYSDVQVMELVYRNPQAYKALCAQLETGMRRNGAVVKWSSQYVVYEAADSVRAFVSAPDLSAYLSFNGKLDDDSLRFTSQDLARMIEAGMKLLPVEAG